VESTASLELDVALALVNQAKADIIAARAKKDWGEELRRAEERLLDAMGRVAAIRRRLSRPHDHGAGHGA
jgi:hypothetical protein